MKAILILLAMMSTAAIAAPSDEVWQMPSQWKGQRYRAWVTREMFDKSPAWSPESGQEEPLSVSKAVAVSASTLKAALGPDEFDKCRVESVGLWQISPPGQTKWFYVVRWIPKNRNIGAQVSPADFEGFTLVVTLTGDCPTPKLEQSRKESPNKSPEATR